jgi:hypothetical protein
VFDGIAAPGLAPDMLREIFDAAAWTTEKALDTETNVGPAHRPHRRIATTGQLGSRPLHHPERRHTRRPAHGRMPGRCNILLSSLEPALRADWIALQFRYVQ